MCNIGDIVLIESNKSLKTSKRHSRIGYKKYRDLDINQKEKPALIIDSEYVNGVEYYYYLSLIEYKFGTIYDEERFVRISKEKAAQLGLEKTYLLDLGIIHKTFDDYTKSGQYCATSLSKVLNRFVDYQEHKLKCEQYYLVKASVRRQIEKVKEISEDNMPTPNTLNPRNINVGDLIWVEGTVLKPHQEIDKIHPAVVVSVDLDANEFYYVLATSSPRMDLEYYLTKRENLQSVKEKIHSANYTLDYEKLHTLKKITRYYPFDIDKCHSTNLGHNGFINVDNIYKKKITLYNSTKKRYISNFTKIGEVKPDYLLSVYKEIIFFQEIINKRTAQIDEFYDNVKEEIVKRLNNNLEKEHSHVKVLDRIDH